MAKLLLNPPDIEPSLPQVTDESAVGRHHTQVPPLPDLEPELERSASPPRELDDTTEDSDSESEQYDESYQPKPPAERQFSEEELTVSYSKPSHFPREIEDSEEERDRRSIKRRALRKNESYQAKLPAERQFSGEELTVSNSKPSHFSREIEDSEEETDRRSFKRKALIGPADNVAAQLESDLDADDHEQMESMASLGNSSYLADTQLNSNYSAPSSGQTDAMDHSLGNQGESGDIADTQERSSRSVLKRKAAEMEVTGVVAEREGTQPDSLDSEPSEQPAIDDSSRERGHLLLIDDVRNPNFVDPSIPPEVLQQLRSQVQRWDQKPRGWEKGFWDRPCVEMIMRHRATIWYDDNKEEACVTCTNAKRICATIRRNSGEIKILPRKHHGEGENSFGPTDIEYWKMG